MVMQVRVNNNHAVEIDEQEVKEQIRLGLAVSYPATSEGLAELNSYWQTQFSAWVEVIDAVLIGNLTDHEARAMRVDAIRKVVECHHSEQLRQWETEYADSAETECDSCAQNGEHGVPSVLSELTTEHLGNSATQGDLDEYRRAVRIAMQQLNMDEEAAIDYVWNNGDYGVKVDALLGRANAVECDSCAQNGEHGVPATGHSTNPEWCGYNLCQECIDEYNRCNPVNSAN